MRHFKVERTLLNDGVQVSKWEDDKLLAGIAIPWEKVGDIAGGLLALSLAHGFLEASANINKALQGGVEGDGK